MSKEHEALKEVARKILQDMGFKEDQIEFEYSVGDKGLKSFRVDTVGITENRKVAIECGNTPGEKIAALKMFFDEVIVLPYFTVNVETETYAKTIRQLNEKIIALEKANKKLYDERQEENRKDSLVYEVTHDFIELLSRWNKGEHFFYDKSNIETKTLIQDLKDKLNQLEIKIKENSVTSI